MDEHGIDVHCMVPLPWLECEPSIHVNEAKALGVRGVRGGNFGVVTSLGYLVEVWFVNPRMSSLSALLLLLWFRCLLQVLLLQPRLLLFLWEKETMRVFHVSEPHRSSVLSLTVRLDSARFSSIRFSGFTCRTHRFGSIFGFLILLQRFGSDGSVRNRARDIPTNRRSAQRLGRVGLEPETTKKIACR